MENEIRERRIVQAAQARRDIAALTRAQGMAHAMWLKTERNERGQWAIVGKKLQEMLVDTERYIRDLEEGRRYKIVRHHEMDGIGPTVIKTGLTLAEAQAHCKREDTHGSGWFDGYTEESNG